MWRQSGRPFPQPPSKALPWRWPGLGPGTPGPQPLSCCCCCCCLGGLPSPSRPVSWGSSLGGPRAGSVHKAAPQAVGCPCGCQARLQGAGGCAGGGRWSSRGHGGLRGGIATGRGPGNGWAVCLGGVLYPVKEGCWAGVFCPVRPESGGSHVSCAQVMGWGLWVRLSCEAGQLSRVSQELCLRLCACGELYPSASCGVQVTEWVELCPCSRHADKIGRAHV